MQPPRPDFVFELASPPAIEFELAGRGCAVQIGQPTEEIDVELSAFMRGPPGPQGNPGVAGLPGAAGGTSFVYTQSIAATVWTIAHGLNRYPSVTVVDSAGNEVEGAPRYIDSNTITVTFGLAFAGEAFLN